MVEEIIAVKVGMLEISLTSKGLKKQQQMSPPQSHQSCHSCTQHVISPCSTFVPSIIKIFHRVFMLQSRDKK